ncbi:MAG: [LysW]-lysine hydrolase, partial [Chloroflexi bacterium]|nr:[LysW]-lysine hydrolase [Chloroflexota bacterium]
MDSLSLLTDLLNLYSPTDHTAEAVNYLVEQMRAAGFAASVDGAGNAVGVMGASHGPNEIVLLGHIDTVPGLIPVRRDGDRLYGRGAVDAKGPLAAFVAAVAQVGPLPDRRFVVIGAMDEEGDSHGARFIADKYRPACLIIGEPSGWERLTLGYKGSAWLEFRARRAVGHTAGQSESACEAAVGFWNRVVAYAGEYNTERDARRVFDQLTPTLRGMRSDSDGFADSAALRLGLRLPPGFSVEELTAQLNSLANGDEIEIFPGAVPAHRAEKNTPLVRAFLAAIRAQGGVPGFTVKTGTSDMNVVAPVWNCPTLAYGPGDSSLDHTPEEHILVSEYLRG